MKNMRTHKSNSRMTRSRSILVVVANVLGSGGSRGEWFKGLSSLVPPHLRNIRGSLVLAACVAAATTFPLRGADCKTMVSGIIDGETWTTNGSPYCVNGDVLVAALTIEPGVEVRFLGNYVFRVEGLLQVKGATAPNQVRFMAVLLKSRMFLAEPAA